MLQDRADKICEMANVMQKSIQIDEQSINKEQELMARLVTENKVRFFVTHFRVFSAQESRNKKVGSGMAVVSNWRHGQKVTKNGFHYCYFISYLQGLREMLEISNKNGSYSNPCVGPRLVSTGCQTEVEAETSPSDHPSPASGDLAFKIINKFSSPIKSANNCTSNCTQNGIENPSVVSGELRGDKAEMRPLSSASEESESSSISEDDEISFNTIKRQIAPKSKCDSSTVTTTNTTNLSINGSSKNNGSSTGLEIDNNNGLNGDTNDKQMINSNTAVSSTETIVES